MSTRPWPLELAHRCVYCFEQQLKSLLGVHLLGDWHGFRSGGLHFCTCKPQITCIESSRQGSWCEFCFGRDKGNTPTNSLGSCPICMLGVGLHRDNARKFQGCQHHGLCCALQAAKTYLEKHFETFPTASLDELVQHGLKALSATLSEGELTKQNVSIAVVGGGAPFVMLDDDDVEPYVAVSSVL